MTSIDKIFPVGPRELVLQMADGSTDTVVVREFTVGQLPEVLRLAKTVYGHVATLQDISKDQAGELIADLIGIAGDDLFAMIGLSIKRNRLWFDNLPIDSSIDLFMAFVECNLSFFVQRVLPKFKTSMEKLRATTTGQTASLT